MCIVRHMSPGDRPIGRAFFPINYNVSLSKLHKYSTWSYVVLFVINTVPYSTSTFKKSPVRTVHNGIVYTRYVIAVHRESAVSVKSVHFPLWQIFIIQYLVICCAVRDQYSAIFNFNI